MSPGEELSWLMSGRASSTTTTGTKLFYGPFSRTTRVSWYQKKHSPTHLCWLSTILYQFIPSTVIHSILPVQFTCLTIFLHNLSRGPLGLEFSTSYSIHFFSQSVSSFRNTCPYHRNLFCCSTKVISSVPAFLVSFSTLYFELSLFTLT